VTSLLIRIDDAIDSARVVLAGTANDMVTPVLQTAWWEPEQKRLVSTDRYCVVSYTIEHSTFELTDHAPEVAIPAELLTWVTKQKRDYDRHIMFTMDERTVSATLVNSQLVEFGSSVASRIDGNRPPVSRLFESWVPAVEAGPVAFNPTLLKRLLTPLSMVFKKDPITIEFGQIAHSPKMGPLRIRKGQVDILVQPNTLTTGR
jgi:hypothetical protein